MKKMTLNEYLTDNNFEKKDLTILFSVGWVLNVKNGDTFPMMNDDTFDFSSPFLEYRYPRALMAYLGY